MNMPKTITSVKALTFILFMLTGSMCSDNHENPIIPPTDTTIKYWGGGVQSIQAFKYGRFMVKMKPERKSGVISSFFTYHCDESTNCDKGEEIDIEFVGSNPITVQLSYHLPTDPKINQHTNETTLTFNSDEDFRVYWFDWTPTYIAWYAEGRELWRINKDLQNPLDQLINYQYIMMNVWTDIKGGWGGILNTSDLPVAIVYDWVKYYSWTQSNGFSPNPTWEDDFTGSITDKWTVVQYEKFPNNNNDGEFVKENVKINNGYLTLWLTKPGSSIPLNLSGTWEGILTQPGGPYKLYDFKMFLLQSGIDIGGTSWIGVPNTSYQGEMALSGSINGDTLRFQETSILSQNPPPFVYWCIKMGTLLYNAVGDSLTGPWTGQWGCSPGYIRLHRTQ